MNKYYLAFQNNIVDKYIIGQMEYKIKIDVKCAKLSKI